MNKEKITQIQVVESILNNDARSRRENAWLLFRVWNHYSQGKIFIPYSDFPKLPSPESIMRCKRDILNKPNFKDKFAEIRKTYNKEFVPEEGVTYEKPMEEEL